MVVNMRKIEEIKLDIANTFIHENYDSPYYTVYLEQLQLYKELVQALESQQPKESNDWQPIETFPNDSRLKIFIKMRKYRLVDYTFSHELISRDEILEYYTHWNYVNPPLEDGNEE